LIIKDKNKLKIKCEPVSSVEEGEIIAAKLLDELSDKGIGLAANQIGINKRVCVVNVKEPIAFINPTIEKLDGDVIVPESCLSFPKKVVKTKRARWVTIKSDNHGKIVLGSDQDDDNLLEAVCAQHEIDHLDGLTMYDKRFIVPPAKSNKIGRNQRVIIKKGKDTKELKFKKIDAYLKKGWQLDSIS
jgi:peptide deformylase